MGDADDRSDLVDRHQIVSDGEPGQVDERDPTLITDRLFEHRHAGGVEEASANMVRRS